MNIYRDFQICISVPLTPVNSKLALKCRKLNIDGKFEKCCTINRIVHIAKNNKLIKIYHIKDLPRVCV